MRYIAPIEAQEQLSAITAATAPHVRPADYRSLRRRLNSVANALYPPAAPEPPREHKEIDRDKARAWFEQKGVKVVKVTETTESA